MDAGMHQVGGINFTWKGEQYSAVSNLVVVRQTAVRSEPPKTDVSPR